jgi:uncharacterized protein DUF4145
MHPSDDIKALVAETIQKGDALISAPFQDGFGRKFVDVQKYHEFLGSCRLVLNLLGSFGDVWEEGIPKQDINHLTSAMMAQGTLDSIREALEKGRLSTIQELATAEVLSDLIEQAEALADKKFYRAAAVILRAILEERLRKLCEASACMPSQNKPTIEHYKQALYSTKVIDKVVQKKIDWMAGVGNAAAHNLPEFRDDDVPILYKDTLDFLARFSP